MTLNNVSYVHKYIRIACQQLEQLENIKLCTELSQEFTEVMFTGDGLFIIIDYMNKTWFFKGREVKAECLALIDDIIVYLGWLEIGKKYTK